MNSTTPSTGSLLQGDCTQLLRCQPAASVDLIVTDPPYLVSYRSRDGRRVPNDDNADWLLPAFAEMYRVLKPNRFCVSFYGWSRVDLFMAAWRRAGFTPVGHLVWQKPYASRRGFLAAHHEQAYLLAKGRPAPLPLVLRDVLPWEYSGNRWHPTEKPVSAIRPLIRAFSRPGELVLDPFAGSGTTAIAARELSRRFLAMELDPAYCEIARRRLAFTE
jgi:site-specific DNA-methyltransferase (adenine-specific)